MTACQKKELMTVETLQAMVKDADRNETLTNVWLVTACLWAFAGFLRFDEPVNIRCCDLILDQEMLKIHISRSKTDQLWKGDEVLIARSEAFTCPVRMLEDTLGWPILSWIVESPCLGNYQIQTKKGEYLKEGGALSYTTMRELFKKKVKKLGYPVEVFSLHSLRAGGASA